MRTWLSTTFAALENRYFRILWLGTTFSFIAFFMSMIVQSVVAFRLSGTNSAVGSVVFAQGLAMAALGPLGGAFADRWPKRRVVAICQLLTGAIFLGLAWLFALDRLTVALLSVGALIMGATFAFLGPARQAMVVDLVPEHRRGNAMALTNIANTLSRVLGPALAGALLGWAAAGAAGAYVTMALCYAISALSLLWLPKSIVRVEASERHVFEDVLDGLRYVWGDRRLRFLVLLFGLVILIGFPHVTLLPGLLEHELGRDAADVSRLYLASALGAVLASVSVAQFADSQRASIIYTAHAVAFGLSLVALAMSPSYLVAAVGMFVVGAASGGFQALNGAVIAREAEPMYIGRVLSLTMLAFAGFGLMALPLGILADWAGERVTLAGMGVVVVVISLGFGTALLREQADGTESSR